MLKEFSRQVPLSFEDTISNLTQKLSDVKFKALCTIDLSQKFADNGLLSDEKIMILEVCNPFEAYNAYQINPKSLFLLPCKIIVISKNKKVYIEMIKPTSLIDILDDSNLYDFAFEIENKLIQAIENVR